MKDNIILSNYDKLIKESSVNEEMKYLVLMLDNFYDVKTFSSIKGDVINQENPIIGFYVNKDEVNYFYPILKNLKFKERFNHIMNNPKETYEDENYSVEITPYIYSVHYGKKHLRVFINTKDIINTSEDLESSLEKLGEFTLTLLDSFKKNKEKKLSSNYSFR